jgi:hypothetical protein
VGLQHGSVQTGYRVMAASWPRENSVRWDTIREGAVVDSAGCARGKGEIGRQVCLFILVGP